MTNPEPENGRKDLREEIQDAMSVHVCPYYGLPIAESRDKGHEREEYWCCIQCTEDKLLALIDRERRKSVDDVVQKITLVMQKFNSLP